MSPVASQTRRLGRGSGGYTAIEVLLAITVLLISSAGVISMQKASIQGNLDARKLDVANSIARTWLDRLSADATSWNATNGMTYTNWLSANLDKGYVTPTTVGGFGSAFDILGRDLTAGDPATIFCAHISVATIADYSTPAMNVAGTPVIVQASVVVFWSKSLLGAQGVPVAPKDMCSVTDAAKAESSNPGTYHMIYATESIRRSS